METKDKKLTAEQIKQIKEQTIVKGNGQIVQK
jgi:hypothetical protein